MCQLLVKIKKMRKAEPFSRKNCIIDSWMIFDSWIVLGRQIYKFINRQNAETVASPFYREH
jgi:hypothetical protein